jgi:hypothetical protein
MALRPDTSNIRDKERKLRTTTVVDFIGRASASASICLASGAVAAKLRSPRRAADKMQAGDDINSQDLHLPLFQAGFMKLLRKLLLPWNASVARYGDKENRSGDPPHRARRSTACRSIDDSSDQPSLGSVRGSLHRAAVGALRSGCAIPARLRANP